MIWFRSERARKQLLDKSIVITARARRKQEGNTMAVYRDDKGETINIGIVKVLIIDESSCVETLTHRPILIKYLNFSGFKTVSEWEDEICIMNRGNKMPLYLKIVSVQMEKF